jgi:dTDP-4-dehydrorhamnose 3,5-epimerase
MIFTHAQLDGVWILDLEPHPDERGFFARTWCRRELASRRLETELAQESLSYNRRRGTLRGLHFQRMPHQETKIVRCIRGAALGVVIDLRASSPTFLRWQRFELTADNRRLLYVPQGCGYGFQTLLDETEVAYQISAFHVPEAAAGYRYDDPAFGIDWPLPVSVISTRDLGWPPFSGEAAAAAGPTQNTSLRT